MQPASRNERLAALGVRQWYARVRLPGAAVSPDFVLRDSEVVSEVQDTGSSQKPLLETESSPKLSPDSARSLLSVEGPKGDALDADSGVQARVAEPAIEIQSRHLCVYHVGELLICSIEEQGQWQPLEFELLANILSACGLGDSKLEFIGEFTWPVFASLRLHLNRDDYFRSALSQWLSVSAKQCKKVVVLGRGDVTLSLDGVWDAIGVSPELVRVGASLADMLSMPSRKAQVWRELQPQISLLQQ